MITTSVLMKVCLCFFLFLTYALQTASSQIDGSIRDPLSPENTLQDEKPLAAQNRSKRAPQNVIVEEQRLLTYRVPVRVPVVRQFNSNQMGVLTNLPSNNFNAIYSQLPVYRNVPYPMNNIGSFGAYPFPLKAYKRALIAQQMQAATGQFPYTVPMQVAVPFQQQANILTPQNALQQLVAASASRQQQPVQPINIVVSAPAATAPPMAAPTAAPTPAPTFAPTPAPTAAPTPAPAPPPTPAPVFPFQMPQQPFPFNFLTAPTIQNQPIPNLNMNTIPNLGFPFQTQQQQFPMNFFGTSSLQTVPTAFTTNQFQSVPNGVASSPVPQIQQQTLPMNIPVFSSAQSLNSLSNRLRNSRIMNGSTGNLLNNISAVNASSMQSVFTNSQPDQVNLPATQMFVDSGTVQGPANTVTAPISQSDVSNTVANGTSTIMSPVPQIMPVISLQNPTNLTPMDIQRIINMSNLNNGTCFCNG